MRGSQETCPPAIMRGAPSWTGPADQAIPHRGGDQPPGRRVIPPESMRPLPRQGPFLWAATKGAAWTAMKGLSRNTYPSGRAPQASLYGRSLRPVSVITILVLILAIAFTATGCSAIAGAFGLGTRKVTDDMGRQVDIPRRINRVVSLAPANTEILFAVGAGAKIVGVDDFSNYPAEAAAVPKIGGFGEINVEAVIALKPDLVLASSMHKAPVEQLEAVGIKSLVVEPRTLNDVYAGIELVAAIVGNEAKGKEVVATMKATIAAVEAKLRDIPAADRPVVFYEVWNDPLMSAGPNTYTHQIIELAGGRNLTADATTDYPIIGFEVVVARDPAVIVFPTFHGALIPSPADLSLRPGWAGIRAVRDGNIQTIDADIMSRGGPRLAEAVLAMAKLLYPDLFQD